MRINSALIAPAASFCGGNRINWSGAKPFRQGFLLIFSPAGQSETVGQMALKTGQIIHPYHYCWNYFNTVSQLCRSLPYRITKGPVF